MTLLDAARQVRLLGVDERRLARNRDGLLHGGDFQRKIQRGRITDREMDPFFDERGEAAELRRDVIGPDRQRRHDVRPRLGGHSRSGGAGFNLRRGNRRARQGGAAFIEDRAAELGLGHLRGGRQRRNECQRGDQEDADPGNHGSSFRESQGRSCFT